MGDTLLTNLCSICHVSTPKYKCPRCNIRTCSLPCNKRHKARSDCDGTRDATAFVPRNKLATPAGLDHDYNFISAIERARERTEGELVEERGIVTAGELRPVMVERLETRMKDGQRRKVVVTRALNNDGRMEWEGMRTRLERFGVVLVRAPVGMSRRRENQTRFFKRSRRIEWFVEWFLVAGGEEGGITRVTTKVADDSPICEAFLRNRVTKNFAIVEAEVLATTSRAPSKPPAANTFQDQNTSAWIPGSSICSQNPRNGQWTERHQEHRQTGVPEEDIQALKGRVDFYISRPKTTSSSPTALKPVDPTMKLHDALSGTAVLEYPSIYVVERSAGLPPGFVVTRPKRGTKRRAEEGDREAKRRAVGELEDGEVSSGEESSEEGSESEELAAVSASSESDDDSDNPEAGDA